MARDENLRVVGEIYAAFGRGDIAAVLERLSDDVEWYAPGAPGVPHGGTRTGRAGVAQFFATVLEHFEFEGFEVGSLRADADTVFVTGRERLRGKKSGRAADNDWAHVFTLRDGRVTAFREYFDTAAVAALL